MLQRTISNVMVAISSICTSTCVKVSRQTLAFCASI